MTKHRGTDDNCRTPMDLAERALHVRGLRRGGVLCHRSPSRERGGSDVQLLGKTARRRSRSSMAVRIGSFECRPVSRT